MARRAEASLRGVRVLVTRPRHQAESLADRLRKLGAHPVELSLIEIAPLQDYSRLDQAIGQLDQYDWIIFTSVNGVAAVFDRIAARSHPEPIRLASLAQGRLREGSGRRSGARAERFAPRNLTPVLRGTRAERAKRVEWAQRAKIAAIGPATAAALAQRGVQAHWVPSEFVAEAIVTEIGDVAGQRILLPRADIARKALAEGLRAKGAVVDEVAAYRTVAPKDSAKTLNGILASGIDVVTFLSSSTVTQFALLADRSRIDGVLIACIGPITAATARQHGFRVDVVANAYTADGLIDAIRRHLGARA
jgi:uroporphyrinogen III methyltransferase/synthase